VTHYFINEARLDLPDVETLTDHTVHALDVTTVHGDRIRFATTRQPFGRGDSLRSLVDRAIAEKERRLPSFQVVSRTERAYPWAEGIEIRFTCKPAEEPLFHHQFYCGLGEFCMTMTAVVSLPAAARCDQWMFEMLANVTVRQ